MAKSKMFFTLCVLWLLKTVCCQSYPSNVTLPTSAITAVSFTCTGGLPLKWKVNNTTFDANSAAPSGISLASSNDDTQSQQTVTVQEANVTIYNGSLFQCSTNGNSFSSVPTAFIIVYGTKFNFKKTQMTF